MARAGAAASALPSPYYSFSFEPNDHRTHHFAAQPDLLRYLSDLLDRSRIGPHVRFSIEVLAAETHVAYH